MINERLFGSPLSGEVKKKLEDRQRVAGEVAFGDSIEAVYPDKDGNAQADLSSRTPFVRMWTSIKFVEPASVEEALEFLGDADYSLEFYEELAKYQPKLDELRKTFPDVVTTEIDKKIYAKYTVERPLVDYTRKIYTIGDHNYQTAYGSVETNESLESFDDEETSSDLQYAAQEVFPQELENNPLLKPQAGILGVSSETEGSLGVVKRTRINFVVHNFYDFDKIYNRYFLKPGATVFVDFGHSTVKNLYNPIDLVESKNIQKFLYESNVVSGYEDLEAQESVEESVENIGEVARNQGDLEVLQGNVVDYNSKILPNGSVECELTLISANAALLDFELDDKVKRHIRDVLYRSTQYIGISSALNNRTTFDYSQHTNTFAGDADAADTSQFKLATPNYETSPGMILEYEKESDKLMIQLLSGQNLTPAGNSIRGGIFVNSLDADDVYVCWGFIEDIIINANFGFGNSAEDINEGNNLQVRMDSSNSFTTWNQLFLDRQKTLSQVAEEPPGFVYPEWWGDSDPGGYEDSVKEESVVPGSYNYFNNKYPKIFYGQDDGFGEHTKIDAGLGDQNSKGKERIPIREVFIKAEIITKAFERSKNVKNAVKDILKKINDSSDGIFDWKLAVGKVDSELMIIDNNRPDINQRILDSGITQVEDNVEENEREQFQNMFQFNVMSPNSIVKQYDLQFKLPQGNIGNMLAAQAMSHESKVFPISDTFDNMIALSSVDNESLSIIYEPDNGGYRASQINAQDNKDGEYFDVYAGAQRLLDDNIYKTGMIRSGDNLVTDYSMYTEDVDLEGKQEADNENKNEQDEAAKLKEQQDKLIQLNIDKLVYSNNKVVTTFSEFYKLREKQEISLKRRPNMLPYTLSLTTVGIGSIHIGDTFRIDYLPKQHFKNTFLQTMKVVHNINTDGWYTTLETQYRLLSEKKQKNYTLDRTRIFMSPKILNNLGLKRPWIKGEMGVDQAGGRQVPNESTYLDFSGKSRKEVKRIEDLIPYITKLRPYTGPNLNYINLVLEFEVTGLGYNSNIIFTATQYYVRGQDFVNGIKTYNDMDIATLHYSFQVAGGITGADLMMLSLVDGPGPADAFHNPPTIPLVDNEKYYLVLRDDAYFITNKENLIPYYDYPHPEFVGNETDPVKTYVDSTLPSSTLY